MQRNTNAGYTLSVVVVIKKSLSIALSSLLSLGEKRRKPPKLHGETAFPNTLRLISRNTSAKPLRLLRITIRRRLLGLGLQVHPLPHSNVINPFLVPDSHPLIDLKTPPAPELLQPDLRVDEDEARPLRSHVENVADGVAEFFLRGG